MAEPGALDGVAIVHEELELDLRPLDVGDPAIVSARYTVRNDGEPLDARLVFVSPGVADGSVSIDGRPVVATAIEGTDGLPASWQPPARVPGVGGRPIEYHVRGAQGLAFTVPIAAGEHEIGVTYSAEPAAFHGGSRRTREYALAYTLAPARTWQSFGTLRVSVLVPTRWDAVTSVPLQRSGDVLAGDFDGLPADSLLIATQPPDVLAPPLGLASLIAGSLVLGALGWRLSGTAARRRWGMAVGCLVAIGIAVIGAVLLALAASLATSAEHSMSTGIHTSRAYAYTAGYLTVGAGLLGLVLGLIAPLAGYVLRRASRRRTPAARADARPDPA